MIVDTPSALYTRPLSCLGESDSADFGARNVDLGEMIRHMGQAGLWAPQGFAISARGHDRFLAASGIKRSIDELLSALAPGGSNAAEIAAAIRDAILTTEIPADLSQEIVSYYDVLLEDVADWPLPVAVLASATPEAMSEATFGGRAPASLVVQSADMLLDAIRTSYAALYTERALAYRMARGVPHDAARLSIAIQTVVWANLGGHNRDLVRDQVDDAEPLELVNADDVPQRQVG